MSEVIPGFSITFDILFKRTPLLKPRAAPLHHRCCVYEGQSSAEADHRIIGSLR